MKSKNDTLHQNYDTKREDYYHNNRQEMIPFIPTTARKILDIGCSTGGFGYQLKMQDAKLEYWGIEPYQAAAKIASLVLDKVICGIFEQGMPELDNQRFDVIVFNDVLEHLVDPESLLKAARHYLSDSGVIVSSIPNILYYPVLFNQIIIREDWKYTLEGVLDNTHLRFFTKKSIIRMFNECGFEIQQITGINKFVPLHYWIMNTLTLNKLKDWKNRQYALVAKPNKKDQPSF